jgi:hypothetical protein
MEDFVRHDDFQGRTGRIYIARGATLMVIIFDDGSKIWNSVPNPGLLFSTKELSDGYWVAGIDRLGGFSDHMANGILYDEVDRPFYPKAKPILPITSEYIEKLKMHFGAKEASHVGL